MSNEERVNKQLEDLEKCVDDYFNLSPLEKEKKREEYQDKFENIRLDMQKFTKEMKQKKGPNQEENLKKCDNAFQLFMKLRRRFLKLAKEAERIMKERRQKQGEQFKKKDSVKKDFSNFNAQFRNFQNL